MIGNSQHTVTTESFEDAVIAQSYRLPVVVDFWAPWCGPCRVLGPVLERLAAAAGGAWDLAKVDIDQHPTLAQRYRVQSIPAVKGFRDGRVVDEFLGAQPESAIRAFLRRIVPSEADQLAAEAAALAASGDREHAEATFRRALALQPDHPRAALELARLLLDGGAHALPEGDDHGAALRQAGDDRLEEARRLLQLLGPATPEGKQAAALLGTLRFRMAASALPPLPSGGDRSDDPAVLYAAGVQAAASGDYRIALDHFLALTERYRRFDDDAGRRSMIAVFDILGPEDPLTISYRPRLAAALH